MVELSYSISGGHCCLPHTRESGCPKGVDYWGSGQPRRRGDRRPVRAFNAGSRVILARSDSTSGSRDHQHHHRNDKHKKTSCDCCPATAFKRVH
jgi:hypothetical protein